MINKNKNKRSLHSKKFNAALVKKRRKRLCEDVRRVKIALNVFETNGSLLHFVSKVMRSEVNVFGFGVIDRVARHVDGRHIVNKHRGWSIMFTIDLSEERS